MKRTLDSKIELGDTALKLAMIVALLRTLYIGDVKKVLQAAAAYFDLRVQ